VTNPVRSNIITGNVTGYAVQVGTLNGHILLERSDYRLQFLTPTATAPHVPRYRRAPSYLLDPRREIVPFRPRPDEMQYLCDWANDPDEPVSLLLLYGAGGVGKTRLASRMASSALTSKWVVAEAGENPADLPAAPTGKMPPQRPPLLVVIDYADRWQLDTLTRLLSSLPLDYPSQRVRVLLIARPGNTLMKSLRSKLSRGVIDLVEPLPLADFEADRHEEFDHAAKAFAAELAVADGLPDPPSDLDSGPYGPILDLHMSALAAVCAHREGTSPPSHANLSDYLLDHERKCWGDYSDITEQAIVVATLFGPVGDRPSAHRLLTRAALADGDAAAEALLIRLAQLHPPAAAPAPGVATDLLVPLRPDRLGEDFIAQCLADEVTGDATKVRTRDLLASDLLSAQATRRCLTVLAAAATRNRVVEAELFALVNACADAFTHAPANVIDLITERANTETASSAHAALPRFSTELLAAAATLAQRLADELPPDAPPEVRAHRLSWLGNRLAEVGRRQEALAPTEEAVTIYRRLTETNPAAYLPDLAMSLNNLGNWLAEVGRRQEALAATEEAVTIHRRLTEANPAAYLPNLAAALNNLGLRLAEVGRRQEALAPTEEAVTIYRRLTETNPAAYLPNLAAALNNLGLRLAEVGRRQEALAPTEEAVTIRRRLTETNPAAYLPNLANALWGFAWVRQDIGSETRPALTAADEAAALFDALSQQYPSRFADDLRAVQSLRAAIVAQLDDSYPA
jgi:tetratricopeptide (TPR) repeat protein